MGADNINSFFLKVSLPYVVEPLTYVYNLCLSQGVFPTALKSAKVIPLPKTKNVQDMNDYRPISNLSVLSKPLEKHIFTHLNKFFERHNLFHPLQSGFRQQHSCHTSLVRMCDSWLSAINKSKPEVTGAVFLDFRKAFDLIDHKLLLMKLGVYFQNSDVLDLVASYLEDRTQRVCLHGSYSRESIILYGVPQGSILGPFLFNLFINDLPIHISHLQVTNELFADDSSLHSSATDIATVETRLQLALDDISDWSRSNRMIIHPGKTKCMAIASRQKHQIQPLVLNLHLSSTRIEQVNEHRVLGILIDSELRWSSHINALCKQLARNLFLLSQLKHFVSQEALELFYNAHCMSHINYASTIWSGAAQVHLQKLNSLHRRAVKIISPHPAQSADDVMKTLKILPLHNQFDYNIALLMFKTIHASAPQYLDDLLIKTTDRYGSDKYSYPKTRLDMFKHSFSFAGPRVWNSLPSSVRSSQSLKSFKASLKKYMLQS
jgi:hypothetical protein